MRFPGARPLRQSGPVRRGAWVTGISSALIVGAVALAGYFDRDPVHVYPAVPPVLGSPPPVAVVNFSGDMGLRFLLGASTSHGLTRAHIPVVGITTPVLFRRHRTRGQQGHGSAGDGRQVLRGASHPSTVCRPAGDAHAWRRRVAPRDRDPVHRTVPRYAFRRRACVR